MATQPSKTEIPKNTEKPAEPSKAAGFVAPDWERIELDYRAGIKTLRQMAGENGIVESAIRKRARRDDWTRDLSGRIKDKADHLVRKIAVRNMVRKESAMSERELVSASAQFEADIRLAHRSDIHRARRLTNSLVLELEQQTDPETLAMLRDLGAMMRQDDDRGQDKRNDLYNKVIDLTERSKTLKTLTESLQKVVDMERQAFGMDKESKNEADSLGKLLNRIAQGNSNGFSPVENDPERHSNSLPLSKDDPDDE